MKTRYRQTALRMLVSVTALLVGFSCWCLWPVVRECVDQGRVHLLRVKLYDMEASGDASSPGQSPHYLYCVDEVKRRVNQISSVTALEELSRHCLADNWRTREQAGDKGHTENWHTWALVCVFYRLSEINSDDSVRALVELYFNEGLPFDGEYSECASEALFTCREKASQYVMSLVASLPEN